MDQRVVDFVQDVAQDIVGLDVALFFQANPRTFDTAAGLALRTHRSIDEVTATLERLAASGVLELFTRGDGRYVCYALAKDIRVWNLLCLLSEAYLDHREERKEIVRIIIQSHKSTRASQATEKGEDQ